MSRLRWPIPWPLSLVPVVACFLVVLFAACSVEKNYKTLSFFFDGVPDPNAIAKVSPGATLVDIQQSPTYSAHKPWQEERCIECHARTLKMDNRDSDLCLKCHATKLTEYPNMHGPVAVGACLWCHNPHNSAYAHLLKAPTREVCSQCHTPAQLKLERVPAHADMNSSCTDCHSGHGGGARFFLRDVQQPAPPPQAGVPAAGTATEEATPVPS